MELNHREANVLALAKVRLEERERKHVEYQARRARGERMLKEIRDRVRDRSVYRPAPVPVPAQAPVLQDPIHVIVESEHPFEDAIFRILAFNFLLRH